MQQVVIWIQILLMNIYNIYSKLNMKTKLLEKC